MAHRTFHQHHFGRKVHWDGYIVRVNLQDDNPMSIGYHSADILLKMDPTEHLDGPDLGITLSERNME